MRALAFSVDGTQLAAATVAGAIVVVSGDLQVRELPRLELRSLALQALTSRHPNPLFPGGDLQTKIKEISVAKSWVQAMCFRCVIGVHARAIFRLFPFFTSRWHFRCVIGINVRAPSPHGSASFHLSLALFFHFFATFPTFF